MKKVSKKKIAVRILLTIFILLVVLAVGAFCVFQFYLKPKYSAQIIEAVNELMNDEELVREIEQIVQDEQLKEDIENAAADEALSADIEAAAQSALGGAPDTQSAGGADKKNDAQPPKPQSSAPSDSTAHTNAPQQTAGSASEPTTKNEPEKQQSPSKKKSLTERAREEASPADFAAGMNIVSKIDVGYLTGLMKGGLTIEEKRAAKAHLTSRLSGSEISKMFSLYSKYSYLLK